MQHELAFLIMMALVATGSAHGQSRLESDANLVIAIDVSGLINARAEAFEFKGLAEALVQPALQEAIAAGQHGRIGFAAFTWSLDGSFNLLVPWTKIAAKAVAAQAPKRSWRQGLGTDLSAAVAQSTRLMAEAPFQAGREVINICANGTDNVFEGPELVRDQALAAGLVVNGLIIGDQPEVEEYFLNRVQGGPGSFVLKILDYADVTQAMLTKFVLDIAWRQNLAAPSAKPG